jgi:hypothetical protein
LHHVLLFSHSTFFSNLQNYSSTLNSLQIKPIHSPCQHKIDWLCHAQHHNSTSTPTTPCDPFLVPRVYWLGAPWYQLKYLPVLPYYDNTTEIMPSKA